MLGLLSTSFGKTVILFVLKYRSCHALVGALFLFVKAILLWEYLDKSVYCANTTDLSLKKGRSTTCKTTRVQLSVSFIEEFFKG